MSVTPNIELGEAIERRKSNARYHNREALLTAGGTFVFGVGTIALALVGEPFAAAATGVLTGVSGCEVISQLRKATEWRDEAYKLTQLLFETALLPNEETWDRQQGSNPSE